MQNKCEHHLGTVKTPSFSNNISHTVSHVYLWKGSCWLCTLFIYCKCFSHAFQMANFTCMGIFLIIRSVKVVQRLCENCYIFPIVFTSCFTYFPVVVNKWLNLTQKIKEKASYDIASKFRYLNSCAQVSFMQMTSASKCLEISSVAASFEILKIIFFPSWLI